jgi:hypothetical protein
MLKPGSAKSKMRMSPSDGAERTMDEPEGFFPERKLLAYRRSLLPPDSEPRAALKRVLLPPDLEPAAATWPAIFPWAAILCCIMPVS